MSLCDAEWSTDHDDTYYGLRASCDQDSGHAGSHSGPVTTWNGEREQQEEAVRLEWAVSA